MREGRLVLCVEAMKSIDRSMAEGGVGRAGVRVRIMLLQMYKYMCCK